MIRNIENYNNEELVNLVNQITDELANRSEVLNRIEVREIVEYIEFPDSFSIEVETYNDEKFTVILDKLRILEIKVRLSKTNYNK